MGAQVFQVLLTDSAIRDLEEIDDYWTIRDEPERGEQYVRDLIRAAAQHLSDPAKALAGKRVKVALLPETREIKVFKSSYRIIYRVDADSGVTYVLRFWHSHRDEPDSV